MNRVIVRIPHPIVPYAYIELETDLVAEMVLKLEETQADLVPAFFGGAPIPEPTPMDPKKAALVAQLQNVEAAGDTAVTGSADEPTVPEEQSARGVADLPAAAPSASAPSLEELKAKLEEGPVQEYEESVPLHEAKIDPLAIARARMKGGKA